MHPKLKLKIYEAIHKAVNDCAEDGVWSGYIQPTLTQQMANAAELVFDSSMDGQEYAERESS